MSRTFNVVYYDSEEDSEDDTEQTFEDFSDEEDNYDSADEDTIDKSELLQNLLSEVANVCAIGLKAYKIEFYDTTKKNFEDKDCKCDFDYDLKGFPIMYDGGEEYIAPYLKKLSEIDDFFEDSTFITNHNFKITT